MSEDVRDIMERCNQALLGKRAPLSLFLKCTSKRKNFSTAVLVISVSIFIHQMSKLIYPLPVTGYLSGRKQKFHTQQFTYAPATKFFIHSDGFEMKRDENFLRNASSLEELRKN